MIGTEGQSSKQALPFNFSKYAASFYMVSEAEI